MSIVSLNGVSYGYPSFDPDSSPFSDGPAPEREFVEQLRDITMTIQPGTLTLLVGASGSGKSPPTADDEWTRPPILRGKVARPRHGPRY